VRARARRRHYPPAFAAFLAEHYRYEGAVQYTELYRRIER